ncbi:MAG: NUDIX domain-containing protein [Planctomycetales bacterium]|nr:NUDIX domain-containing protein [Planctomycetales bacterium]
MPNRHEPSPPVHFPPGSPNPRGRRGVVAIILRENHFLVIRRSQFVSAPGLLCFAGGGIEAGESESEALVREMREELALEVLPGERVWQSVTAWGTQLAWWTAEIPAESTPVPNPAEVEEVLWLPASELRIRAGMLPSMPQFLDAWSAGHLKLPISPH